MNRTFEEYLEDLKKRRDEDEYRYTDEDFETYSSWVDTCWRKGISCYICLELMYFETIENEKNL